MFGKKVVPLDEVVVNALLERIQDAYLIRTTCLNGRDRAEARARSANVPSEIEAWLRVADEWERRGAKAILAFRGPFGDRPEMIEANRRFFANHEVA